MNYQKFSTALSYDDVLLVPQYSELDSRKQVDLSTHITPRVKLSIPLISINMSDVTGVRMAVALGKMGGLGFLPRFESDEKQADMVREVKEGQLAAAAIGIKDGFLRRAEYLVKAGVDILTIDVAHGHLKKTLDATRTLKQTYGNLVDIISGVIATRAGAEDLYKSGADCVRVGVGPGTICTTRIQTGFGVPQISAVLDAAIAAKKHKKTILCDGGTKNSGDIVKGLAAGASAVVIGSQFAGTKEASGKLVIVNGVKYKSYNASTSLSEKIEHQKKLSDSDENYTKHIEGVESVVPYKGALKDVVEKIEANIKSGFSYCGARDIKQLWHKAKFIRVTTSGLKENGAHDVILS